MWAHKLKTENRNQLNLHWQSKYKLEALGICKCCHCSFLLLHLSRTIKNFIISIYYWYLSFYLPGLNVKFRCFRAFLLWSFITKCGLYTTYKIWGDKKKMFAAMSCFPTEISFVAYCKAHSQNQCVHVLSNSGIISDVSLLRLAQCCASLPEMTIGHLASKPSVMTLHNLPLEN